MRRLLIIGKIWPEPTSSAAGLRMLQLIDLFIKTGKWEVHFASSAVRSVNAASLEEQGVICTTLRLNDSSTDDFFTHLQPQVVIFDRFVVEEQFGWRVARSCPNAMRILDTEDLHFLREARELALKNDSEEKEELFNSVARREIAAILRSDLNLIISSVEVGLLMTTFGVTGSTLWYLPFLWPELKEEELASYPTFEDRRDFAFIGNFKHAPNRDAVFYLKQKIWPQLHAVLPEARMKVYGAYPSAPIQQLHNPGQGFEVLGRIADVDKAFKSTRVLLAPLRFGAGLKGKFFDAMRNGIPSVTTPLGAEGIALEEDFPGLLATSPTTFVNSAVALYKDPLLWKERRDRACELIRQNFAVEQFREAFLKGLEEHLTNLTVKREQNFWQQMTMQHRLLSTKYMARWIEAKNTVKVEKLR